MSRLKKLAGFTTILIGLGFISLWLAKKQVQIGGYNPVDAVDKSEKNNNYIRLVYSNKNNPTDNFSLKFKSLEEVKSYNAIMKMFNSDEEAHKYISDFYEIPYDYVKIYKDLEKNGKLNEVVNKAQ